jgi:hypothetical protein
MGGSRRLRDGIGLNPHHPTQRLKAVFEVPLAMARQVDAGIEDGDIAAVGRRLDRMPDWELSNYGLDKYPASPASLSMARPLGSGLTTPSSSHFGPR